MDVAAPDTSLQRLQSKLAPVFQAWVEGRRWPVLLRWFLRWLATPAGTRFAQRRARANLRRRLREARQDPRGTELLRTIRRADTRAPFASAIALLELLPNEETSRQAFAAAAQVEQITRLRGEARARAAANAVLSVSESTYKTYLRFLFRLVFLTEGRQPPVPSTVGALICQISSKIADAPSLVHPEVAWLRNGIAHRHFHYDDATDSLVFTLPDEPVRSVTSRTMQALSNDMMRLSGDVAGRVGGLYFYRDVMSRSGMGSAVLEALPDVLSRDPGVRQRAGSFLCAHVEHVFQPLFELERAAPPFPIVSSQTACTHK